MMQTCCHPRVKLELNHKHVLIIPKYCNTEQFQMTWVVRISQCQWLKCVDTCKGLENPWKEQKKHAAKKIYIQLQTASLLHQESRAQFPKNRSSPGRGSPWKLHHVLYPMGQDQETRCSLTCYTPRLLTVTWVKLNLAPPSETTLCWETLIMGLYPGKHNLHDPNLYANPSIAVIWRLMESWDRDGLSIWSGWSRWRDFPVNPTWPGRPWGSSRRALLWSGRPAAATPVWIKNGWLKTPEEFQQLYRMDRQKETFTFQWYKSGCQYKTG